MIHTSAIGRRPWRSAHLAARIGSLLAVTTSVNRASVVKHGGHQTVDLDRHFGYDPAFFSLSSMNDGCRR
jgi:hypothetical protein